MIEGFGCRLETFRLITSILMYSVVPCALHRKDQKKVTKLEAQIPYHEGRGNKDEVVKIKEQIADIWEKAKLAAAMD